MAHFTWNLDLPLPVERVFSILADPANAVTLALPELNFQLLEGPARLVLGAKFKWKATRWGFSKTIVTEVTAFEEDALIVEEQREGPLPRWLHTRRFQAKGEGTHLSDEIEFEPPGGMLGFLVTKDVIEKELRKAFEHRDRALQQFPA